MSSRGTQNMKSFEINDLYKVMKNVLNVRLFDYNLSIVLVFITVQFLFSVGYYGFFGILHLLMLAQKGAREWQHV